MFALRRSVRQISVLAILLTSASSLAFGHYHWSYFAHRSGTFTDMPLKYDVNALPDKTVPFFISKSGPGKLVDGDNFNSLISEIRRAAESWNAVPTSALRLRFGGLVDYPDTPPSAADLVNSNATPSIEVFFDDEMAPGILALSWPQTKDDLTYLAADSTPDNPNPGFVPLLKSRLQLRSDLTVNQQASFSDDFFLTIVHEFGHNLGLQHSTSSATMSTSLTRATSKANPLSADDIAGVSWLYPADGYAATVGSIAGHITVAGSQNPANLASVVALSTNGTVINAMTGPDGAYQIAGLPPGDYFLYAHPLPPAQSGESSPAGIVPQIIVDGKTPAMPFTATTGFDTRFFPGTREWSEAAKITVTANQTVADVNMDLPRNITSVASDLRMYAYLGDAQAGVHAPPVVPGFHNWLVFNGTGTLVSGTERPAPGLRLSVIGSDAPASLETPTLQYWQQGFLLIGADAGDVKAQTQVAVAVNTDAGLYVLPSAFSVTPSQHPFISKVSDSGDGSGSVRVEGTNLNASTRVLFDGAEASAVQANDDGSLTVKAPPALDQQQSFIEALTSGGQTSWQILGTAAPPLYNYGPADQPSVVVTGSDVTAGTDTMLRIDGINTNFLTSGLRVGHTVVGFGTPEITVRQMWVVNANQLLLNIGVTAAAKTGPVVMTIATGLQVITVAGALLVHPSDKPVTLRAPILNVLTGLSGAPVGGSLVMQAIGVPDDFTGWKMKIGDAFANVTKTGPTELHADVPAVSLGVLPVQLIPPFGVVPPQILFQVDGPPPVIMTLSGDTGATSQNYPLAKIGTRVSLTVTNLGAEFDQVTPDMVQIRVGNVLFAPDDVTRIDAVTYRVSFILSSKVPANSQQQVTVGVGTRVSSSRTMVVAPLPVAP